MSERVIAKWNAYSTAAKEPLYLLEDDPAAPSVSEIVEATRYYMNRSRKVLEGKPVRDYDEAWSRLDNLIARLEEK